MATNTGTINKDNGNFGFIKPDELGASDMFVMVQHCEAFGRVIPSIGTRVQYSVVADSRTGRPRADGVQPLGGVAGLEAVQAQGLGALAGQWGAGVDENLHLAQQQAQGYGQQGYGQQAHPGTLDVDLQSTAQTLTQQLLANMPGLAHIDPSALGIVGMGGNVGGGQHHGTVSSNNGKFGFITQDAGGDMFCLPPIPPVGTRVSFDAVTDPKTGRLRADNVQQADAGGGGQSIQGTLEQLLAGGLLNAISQQTPQTPVPQYHQQAGMGGMGGVSAAAAMAAAMGRSTGTMAAERGSFGFITQDSGEPDMFTLPPLFPVGTRVSFDVVQDPKTGRPRADNVTDENGYGGGAFLPQGGAAKGGKGSFAPRPSPYDMGQAQLGGMGMGAGGKGMGKDGRPQSKPGDQMVTGTISKSSDKFAFITQDSGESDMFVIPPSCGAFGKVLPPVGTRVMYQVVLDQRSGRPRAESVQPAPEM